MLSPLVRLVRRASAMAAAVLVTASLANGLVLTAPATISINTVNGGTPALITVSGGFPQGPGLLGLSVAGPGPGGNTPCGAVLLTPPINISPIPFSNLGSVTIVVSQLPPSLSIPTVYLQALAFFPTNCVVSNGASIDIVP